MSRPKSPTATTHLGRPTRRIRVLICEELPGTAVHTPTIVVHGQHTKEQVRTIVLDALTSAIEGR